MTAAIYMLCFIGGPYHGQRHELPDTSGILINGLVNSPGLLMNMPNTGFEYLMVGQVSGTNRLICIYLGRPDAIEIASRL